MKEEISSRRSEIENLQGRVQALSDEINEIQGRCEHQWEICQAPVEKESLVPGTFFASRFSLTCKQCALELKTATDSICPRCFSKMGTGTFEDREIYYGEPYLYYTAVVYDCRCGFRSVYEEWDQ